MRINHNIAALNTYRQLTIGNANAAKNMEKLSSGLRINRAGDDAAGLAISEKMRGQIRGLEMASKNAQDGISLIQTAEGALNETHAILQRMRELAVQSANDTNTEVDRQELQKEIDQLSQELSRIGATTEFNTQKLLDGSFRGTFHIGANEGQNLSLQINDMRGFALGMAGDVKASITLGSTVSITDGNTDGFNGVNSGTVTYSVSYNNTLNQYEMKDNSGTVVGTSTDGLSWTSADSDDSFTLSDAVKDGGSITIDHANGEVTGYTATEITNNGLEAGQYTIDFVSATEAYILDGNGNKVAKSTDAQTFTSMDGSTTVLTLGEAVGADGTITIGGIDISSQTSANAAITKINDAIEKVSAERAKLGAYQNRLEHTINNLGTSAENLTAAESRIRDVDMAREMMEFTKNNILVQAAQAMLAQSSQIPQAVLQLLR
jgi:flagellin